MSIQPDELYLSIARIEGSSRGVAFLIEHYKEPHNGVFGLWMTCTHVCGEDGSIKAYISQDCRFSKFEIEIPLEREKCFPEDNKDLALLYSPEPLPSYLRPLPTRHEWDSVNNPIALYGFPQDSRINGVPVSKVKLKSVRSRDNRDNPQILFKEVSVSAGFSGSPIYDIRLGAVVGMVCEVANSDNLGRRTETVFGIPLSYIGITFPQLSLYPLLPVSQKRVSTQTLMQLTELEILNRLSNLPLDKLSLEQKMERAEFVRRLQQKLFGASLADQEKHKAVLLFYEILGNKPLKQDAIRDISAMVDDDHTPWHQKCIVVSALSLSLIAQLEKVRLLRLLRFVQACEEQVWQRALTGLMLALVVRDKEVKKEFPKIAKQIQLLQYDKKIQQAIRHLVQFWRNLDFAKYSAKTKKYIERKTKFHQHPSEPKQWEREFQKLQDDIGLNFFIKFNEFKQASVFQNPHFWFLPFYKGNEAVLQLLRLKEDKVPGEKMEYLLQNTNLLSDSQKYALCYHYEQLSNLQVSRLAEIFSEELHKEKAPENNRESEPDDYTIFKLILHDLYQFQLFFPQDRMAELIDYSLQQSVKPLDSIMVQEEIQLELEAERFNHLGNSFSEKGELDFAIKHYEKAIKLKPDFAIAYRNLGSAYYDKRELDKAIQQFQIAIKHEPDFAAAYNDLGNVYLYKDEVPNAIEHFQKAIECDPNFAYAYLNLGNLFYLEGEQNKAIYYYEKALEFKLDGFSVYHNLANALYFIGELDKAGQYYQRTIKQDPEFANAYNNLGNALFKEGKWDVAIEYFEKAIELDPDSEFTFYNLGNALYAKGELDAAIQQYKKAIVLKPDFTIAYHKLGNALYKQNKLEEAMQSYNQAININPDFEIVYNDLGNVHYKTRELHKAVKCYKKAITLKPNFAIAYNNLASTLSDLDKLEKAVRYYHKAIEIDQNYTIAYYNLGNALSKQGELNTAIIHYKKAIELDPNFEIAFNSLGNILYNKGEFDAAIQYYREAIKLDHGYTVAYNNLATALFDKGEIDAAIQYYREAIKLDHGYTVAYNNLATALFDKGEIDAAIQNYEVAIKLDPKYFKAYKNLGDAFLKKGDLDSAEVAYHMVLTSNPEHEFALLKFGHILFAKGQHKEAKVYYCRSRDQFSSFDSFYNNMKADYQDFQLVQYGIKQKVYTAIVDEL